MGSVASTSNGGSNSPAALLICRVVVVDVDINVVDVGDVLVVVAALSDVDGDSIVVGEWLVGSLT